MTSFLTFDVMNNDENLLIICGKDMCKDCFVCVTPLFNKCIYVLALTLMVLLVLVVHTRYNHLTKSLSREQRKTGSFPMLSMDHSPDSNRSNITICRSVLSKGSCSLLGSTVWE